MNADIRKISEIFVRSAVEAPTLYMKEDGAGGRRAGARLSECYCQLRDLGEEGLAELRRLMSHPNMAVRLGAAGKYRWVDRYEGLKVIQALANGRREYPVGSFEREVAFTASAVFDLSTRENPPGEDPYIAWQKAKKEKAEKQG